MLGIAVTAVGDRLPDAPKGRYVYARQAGIGWVVLAKILEIAIQAALSECSSRTATQIVRGCAGRNLLTVNTIERAVDAAIRRETTWWWRVFNRGRYERLIADLTEAMVVAGGSATDTEMAGLRLEVASPPPAPEPVS